MRYLNEADSVHSRRFSGTEAGALCRDGNWHSSVQKAFWIGFVSSSSEGSRQHVTVLTLALYIQWPNQGEATRCLNRRHSCDIQITTLSKVILGGR